MYRSLFCHSFASTSPSTISIYCDDWPCDRKCGRFHKPFIATTKMQERMASIDSSESSINHNEVLSRRLSTFEQIMERAQRKVSRNEEPPLPDLKRLGLALDIVRKKSHEIAPEVKDTTCILYDKPVWDNAELRAELLDSDADDFLKADPPTEIGDNESTLDEIIKQNQHDTLSNPIEHLHADEALFSDSDENDYSRVDLSIMRQLTEDSVDLPSPKRGRLTKHSSVAYEGSLEI